jgi:hypothetical protein
VDMNILRLEHLNLAEAENLKVGKVSKAHICSKDAYSLARLVPRCQVLCRGLGHRCWYHHRWWVEVEESVLV